MGFTASVNIAKKRISGPFLEMNTVSPASSNPLSYVRNILLSYNLIMFGEENKPFLLQRSAVSYCTVSGNK